MTTNPSDDGSSSSVATHSVACKALLALGGRQKRHGRQKGQDSKDPAHEHDSDHDEVAMPQLANDSQKTNGEANPEQLETAAQQQQQQHLDTTTHEPAADDDDDDSTATAEPPLALSGAYHGSVVTERRPAPAADQVIVIHSTSSDDDDSLSDTTVQTPATSRKPRYHSTPPLYDYSNEQDTAKNDDDDMQDSRYLPEHHDDTTNTPQPYEPATERTTDDPQYQPWESTATMRASQQTTTASDLYQQQQQGPREPRRVSAHGADVTAPPEPHRRDSPPIQPSHDLSPPKYTVMAHRIEMAAIRTLLLLKQRPAVQPWTLSSPCASRTTAAYAILRQSCDEMVQRRRLIGPALVSLVSNQEQKVTATNRVAEKKPRWRSPPPPEQQQPMRNDQAAAAPTSPAPADLACTPPLDMPLEQVLTEMSLLKQIQSDVYQVWIDKHLLSRSGGGLGPGLLMLQAQPSAFPFCWQLLQDLWSPLSPPPHPGAALVASPIRRSSSNSSAPNESFQTPMTPEHYPDRLAEDDHLRQASALPPDRAIIEAQKWCTDQVWLRFQAPVLLGLRHAVPRQVVAMAVVRVYQQHDRRSRNVAWWLQLARRVHNFEAALYRTADSLAAYQDLSTLTHRLVTLSERLDQSTTTTRPAAWNYSIEREDNNWRNANEPNGRSSWDDGVGQQHQQLVNAPGRVHDTRRTDETPPCAEWNGQQAQEPLQYRGGTNDVLPPWDSPEATTTVARESNDCQMGHASAGHLPLEG
jgi:hypothetical protein